MDPKVYDIIIPDETLDKKPGNTYTRESLTAYCTSPKCCGYTERIARTIKEVTVQTDVCPDCGYYLFWHTPESGAKLY